MQHVYKGDIYLYEPEIDEDEDNRKIFHFVYELERDIQGDRFGPKKQVGWMPMSPYSSPSYKEFKMWIECGMPSKKDMGLRGNAQNGDIEKYYDSYISNIILGE